MLLTARIFFLLPHHHHLAGGMVAYSHHIDTGGKVVITDDAARHVVDGDLGILGALNHDAAIGSVDADAVGGDAADALCAAVSDEVTHQVEVVSHGQRIGIGCAAVAPVVEVVAAVGCGEDHGLGTGACGHGENLHGAHLLVVGRGSEGEASLFDEVGKVAPAGVVGHRTTAGNMHVGRGRDIAKSTYIQLWSHRV